MIDLAIAFRSVVEALEAIGARYVVVGSTAAAVWGVARATRDVDLVTVVSSDEVERLLTRLDHDELYVPDEDAYQAARLGGSFNVLHPRSGGKVDVFVSPATDAFTRSRLERRVAAEVLGVQTWIASPEDVVLAKLRWRLESRSEVQWRDCAGIAATQTLDVAYLRFWAPQLGVSADLAELLAQQ